MSESTLAEGTILNNRYRILRVLSEAGGMGLVYLAADQNFSDDKVVIKQSRLTREFLRKEIPRWTDQQINDEFERRRKAFAREARLLRALQHNSLPRVIDNFEVENVGQFFVMDFIPGENLTELLAERLKNKLGAFPVETVLDWADQLLEVLEYLHSQPVIHKDIKPDNIKLRESDGRLMLLDFGLAKGGTDGMSVVASLVGHTPHFAPLEQISRKSNEARTDARTDIYSVAVTLHYLLSARDVSDYPADALERLTETSSGFPDPLRPVHEINPQVSQSVSDVLKKAASIFQNDRYATASEFRTALQKAFGHRDSIRDEFSKAPTLVDDPKPVFPQIPVEPVPEKAIASQPVPEVVSSQTGKGWKVATAGLALTAIISAGVYVSGKFNGTGSVNPSGNNSSPAPSVTISPAPAVSPIAKNAAQESFTEDLGNNVKLEMIALPGGTFTMGSDNGEPDEKDPHQVTVSAFTIGKYEVTQAQWKAVMGRNPSNFKGDDLPVESVSWNDAVAFCKKLSGKTGKTYRLPTEAEWEYACRAGPTGDYAGNLDEMAWYGNNSGNAPLDAEDLWFNVFKKDVDKYSKRLQDNGCQTHPVGQRKANTFKLYDMHGNVWEWCQDWYGENYYKQSPERDPKGPSSGKYRVLRGGSWNLDGGVCRSAFRFNNEPVVRDLNYGFRLVISARTL